MSIENCKAHGELGQALNAFSIEYEPLQEPLDSLGQKFDNSGYELQALVDSQEVLVETIEIGIELCRAAKVLIFITLNIILSQRKQSVIMGRMSIIWIWSKRLNEFSKLLKGSSPKLWVTLFLPITNIFDRYRIQDKRYVLMYLILVVRRNMEVK